MTVSSERLADVDAQLEALGVSEERISEVRARVAEGFAPDLSRIDESLAELSADLEGLEAIVAEARAAAPAPAPALEPSLPVEDLAPAPAEEEIEVEEAEPARITEEPELEIEELDIEELEMDVDEIEIDDASGVEDAPVSEVSSEPESPFDEPLPESPFDEPLPESPADESGADDELAAEAASPMSAQDLFDQAMEDDSEAPAAVDDLAGMLEEEVSASGDIEAPAQDEATGGESDIGALLDTGGEIHAMAEPSALVDLASLETDEGDAMVEIGAVLEEEAAEDASAPEGEDGDDDDPEDGEKKGFFKKLFG